MRIKELVMSNRELVILLAVLGGGVGAAQIAKNYQATAYTFPTPTRSDTLAVLATDVSQLKRDVSALSADMQAMLRAQCVTNPTRWEVYETAGIQCDRIIPSARQAGRVRR